MSKVTAVVIHHENKNQPYLDRCLESLKRQTHRDLDVIVISSTLEPCDVPPWVKIHQVPRSTTGPAATNLGAKLADPATQYFLHLNDDVILNEHALTEMVYLAGDNPVIVNPFSNCDVGWLYGAEIELKNAKGDICPMKRFMRLDEVEGFEEAIMTYPKGYRIALPQSQLCMYATLFPKSVWERLGGYNTEFVMGYADTDLSIRAIQMGAQLQVCLSAFIFHFGGVTTSVNETNASRDKDKNLFMSKWGHMVKDHGA